MPTVSAPEIVLERLRGLPGGDALLDVAAERSDVELVGGAVRDLLLGREPRELDVVVGDSALEFARAIGRLVRMLPGYNPDERFESTFHERFQTALVWWEGGHIDIATRRAESYTAPGALPDVRAGTPEEDLERRDFTVNAIAISLGGKRRGALRHVPNALEDLATGRLRALHERSFLEDPTRLLRMARYSARLDFELEETTAAQAQEAIAAGALGTVSGARIGAELRLALTEPEPVAPFAAMSRLGVLDALHPRLRFEEPVARATLALLASAGLGGPVSSSAGRPFDAERLSADGRPDLALLASLVLPLTLRTEGDPRAEIVALLDRWDFPGGDRDRVAAAAAAVPRLVEDLPAVERPSSLRALARGVPL
jgi:tRNA nucleotidyltransferase (CCA-adding enzyme)